MPADPQTLDALYDTRDNILLAQKFVTALSFDIFKVSKLHFYATTYAIEMIQAASRRLPDQPGEQHSDLPWRAIRDAGNVYRHDDDADAESRIWATVHERLPPLLDAVLREIAVQEGL